MSLDLFGRAKSEAPAWKKSQEAGRPYSLSVRGLPYLVRRSIHVPDKHNRNPTEATPGVLAGHAPAIALPAESDEYPGY